MAKGSFTVGLVGLGFGRAHIPAFQSQGCRVVAVCQRNLEHARAVASRYGVAQVFDRWEAMLEAARPEIVVIAAPPCLHHPIAVEALSTGAHVLCEKPLALDAGEARAMVEAAARAGRIGMTCFNWRSPAAMRRLHALVGEGALGRVFQVHLRYLVPRWADEAAAPTWRMDRAVAGHGVMGDLGVHLVDLVRWTFGEFTRVAAQAGQAYAERTVPGGGRRADAEDFCSVLGELASGAQATLTVSRAARGMNEQTLEAYGSRGAAVYRLVREGPGWYRGELRVTRDGGVLAREPARTGLARSAGEGDPLEVIGKATIAPLVKALLGGIRRGVTPSPSFEDGLRAQAVLDAARESASRGTWMPVAGAAAEVGP